MVRLQIFVQALNSHSFATVSTMETRKRTFTPGFYAKYPAFPLERCTTQPTLPDKYIVERLVSKRLKAGKTEFFVKWMDWPPETNTWEPAHHIPAQLREDFGCPDVPPCLLEDARERLQLVLEQGLKSALMTDTKINVRHDVVRALFPCFSKKALSKSFFSASKEDFERAGLESCFLKIVSRSRVERRIDFPVLLKPFLAKAPSFFSDDGEPLPVRRLEQLRVQFTKSTRAL